MSHAYRTAFREWFGLRGGATDVLLELYRAAGECVTEGQLAKTAGLKIGSVKFYICELRKALESEAIDTAPGGLGYRLTEGGLDECKGALWTMGEELRRAG